MLLAVVAAALWLAWGLLLPVRWSQAKLVMLRPGWSSRHIANELRTQGVIRSANAFLLLHYLGKRHTLKAGEYKFENPESALQVHRRLARGDVYVHTLVIPEGFNLFDIGSAIEQSGLGSRSDFLRLTQQEAALVRDIDPQATSLEGYLFPDTYGFTRTQSLQDIIATMVKRFKQEALAIGLNGDVHRMVTLASIIERETAASEERPLVASVYLNRLQRGMALAADPTVIYAALLAGHYDGTIYQSTLQVDSAYNTYRHAGLPPGPIANPGRASLLAAMHPAQSPYLYFVSNGNGHHRFANTFDEHSRNVAMYRRVVNTSKP